MNTKTNIRITVIAAFIGVLFITAVTVSDNDYISHEVRKGESVSLLCIEIYGFYSNELGAAFAEDNPSVENINLIFVGQKLRFKKPVTEEAVTKKDTVSTE